jgi:glycosyltransferase involved in cell wall biosynthesis
MDFPKISVVVPSYNQGQFIEQTILSVIGQSYPNLEVLVIDGGSQDETVDVVRRYERSLAYWVSEPDRGQGHAINKGFRRATGSILAWLNSDDMYLPGALLDVARQVGSTGEPTLLYGGCVHVYEGSALAATDIARSAPVERLKVQDFIVQPSAFWTREAWLRAGEIDESYDYVLDWDWFIRASRVSRFVRTPHIYSIYRHHDAHKTGIGGEKRAREVLRLIAQYNDEDWVRAYAAVVDDFERVQRRIAMVRRLKYWPAWKVALWPLLLKHGEEKIAVALGMLL